MTESVTNTIELLSVLGKMYYTYFGFRNTQFQHPGKTALSLAYIPENADVFERAFKEGHLITRDILVDEDEEEDKFTVKSFEDLVNDEEYDIIFDTNYLEQKAKTILPYKKIIIKYTKNTWRSKFTDFNIETAWYNQKSKWFVHKKSSSWSKEDVLPFLNTRSYINVVEPFMNVEIEKSLKKDFLTIDDILFATRALAGDETRVYDKFSLISEKNGVLTLTVEMDNYSS